LSEEPDEDDEGSLSEVDDMGVEEEIDELQSAKSGEVGGLNSVAGDLEADVPGYYCKQPS
jgi:hypothetical protein